MGKINFAQKLIQRLKNKQSKIYDSLISQLPKLKKNEEERIFDYVYNEIGNTLSLGEEGLKIGEIFSKQ